MEAIIDSEFCTAFVLIPYTTARNFIIWSANQLINNKSQMKFREGPHEVNPSTVSLAPPSNNSNLVGSWHWAPIIFSITETHCSVAWKNVYSQWHVLCIFCSFFFIILVHSLLLLWGYFSLAWGGNQRVSESTYWISWWILFGCYCRTTCCSCSPKPL